MQFKLIIFDLGSTLLYFQGDWDRVIDEAISKLAQQIVRNGHPINVDKFQNIYAKALNTYYIERDVTYTEKSTILLLQELLSVDFHTEMNDDEIVNVLDVFYQHTANYWKLDPEAIPLLEQLLLSGYRLGLISNASYSRDVYMQLKTHQLLPYFEQILVSADVGYRKPHPLIFRKALNFFKVEANQAVMVGDTLNADIIGSRHVGMKNIWIAQWASPPTTHYRDDAIIPDRTINQLNQIPAVLTAW
jgi:HAD superfamily hydrolase (TIGR01662 family)